MNPAYRLLALVGAVLLLTVGAYQFGRHVRTGEVAQQQLDDALAYAVLVREAQADADQLSADLATARAAQAPKDQIITREVIRYVQVTPPADRVLLPDAWRVLHNAAATGTPADPGAGPLADGTAGPVEDAAALEAIDQNYATCRDSAAKLAGWRQRWEKIEQQLKKQAAP